jgi:hypothetical protein
MSMDTQSNTRFGDLAFPAGEDLTGLEGRLVKVEPDEDDVVVALLPEAASDRTPYVLVEGGNVGEPVRLQPLASAQNVRLVLKGTSVVAGDALVLVSGSGYYGKVSVLPSAQGTYRVVAIAEEAAAEGALVRARPWHEVVVVAGQQ